MFIGGYVIISTCSDEGNKYLHVISIEKGREEMRSKVPDLGAFRFEQDTTDPSGFVEWEILEDSIRIKRSRLSFSIHELQMY